MENFYRIDNLLHHGFPVYYLITEDTKIKKATEFNDKYIYYYKSPNQNEEYKLLGKFLGKGKLNTHTPYNDYDYEVYNFENEPYIYCDKSEFIYCMLIPQTPPKENGRNLLLIQNFTYNDYPVYVHCVKENN
jgi:hypothetical protein